MKQILKHLSKDIIVTSLLVALSLVITSSLVRTTTSYALANCSSQSNVAGSTKPKQDQSGECSEVTDCNESLAADKCGITAVIINITNLLSALVGVVTIIMIIIGGIQYSASSGDPNAANAAKKRITNALLALVIFGFIYAFLQWVVPGGAL